MLNRVCAFISRAAEWIIAAVTLVGVPFCRIVTRNNRGKTRKSTVLSRARVAIPPQLRKHTPALGGAMTAPQSCRTILLLFVSMFVAHAATITDSASLQTAVAAYCTDPTTPNYGNIELWDTSGVESMASLILGQECRDTFNENVNAWDTSKVMTLHAGESFALNGLLSSAL